MQMVITQICRIKRFTHHQFKSIEETFYFILHHVNNEGIIEKSLVVYENRLTAGDFEAQATMDDRDSTLLVGELNEHNNDALAKRFQWIRPTSRRNYKYTFGLGDRLGNASNAHLRLF
jgi:tagaturonate epimerase